jgi:hypothetical protein
MTKISWYLYADCHIRVSSSVPLCSAPQLAFAPSGGGCLDRYHRFVGMPALLHYHDKIDKISIYCYHMHGSFAL